MAMVIWNNRNTLIGLFAAMLCATWLFYTNKSRYGLIEELWKENENLRAEILQIKRHRNPGHREIKSNLDKQVDDDVASMKLGHNSKLQNTEGFFDRKIPQSRSLTRNLNISAEYAKTFQKRVTIIIYNANLDFRCVKFQLQTIRSVLPDILIIVSTTSKALKLIDKHIKVLYVVGEGEALNKMTAMVKTKMFLYLSEGAVISQFDSDNSVAWLAHALDNIQELDIVGASILRYNASLPNRHLDIQCYRLKMCYWVFKQSYEYKYSVGDMMVCEETSSSFMARTNSLSKVGKFDETLKSLVTTDFFLRGKNTVVVGLRPEVFVEIKAICTANKREQSQAIAYRTFMKKYDLYRVEDSFGNRYTLPPGTGFKSPFTFHSQGGFHPVGMWETLRDLLHISEDFFKLNNITHLVEAGVALGGLKMRDILPWDTGDIDMGFWADSKVAQRKIESYCKQRKIPCYLKTSPIRDGQPELMLQLKGRFGVSTMFPHKGAPRPKKFLVMPIGGRYVTVAVNVFRQFRKYYSINYLQNRERSGKLLKCTKPHHHACVPNEFANGGGNWKEFYCAL